MRRTFVINGDLVLPDRIIRQSGLVLAEGRIAEVGFAGQPPEDAVVIDAGGGYILPGLVDIHLHGGGGDDFMDGTAATIRRIARIHAQHGTTTILPTTVACSLDELLRLFDLCRGIQNEGTGGADLPGLHLEGPYLAPAMRGAQPLAYVRDPDPGEVDRILDAGRGLIRRWSSAPELPGMEQAAAKMRAQGITLAVAHSNATCPEIIRASGWGFRHITHMYCSTPSVRKINQTVQAGIVEAAYLIDGMTVELIGDGCHVPKELMQMVHKLLGPAKVALITDAMRAAGTDVRESFLGSRGSGNPVIIEDGVAKLPDRSSFAGSIATADRVLRNAHIANGLPLADAVRMLSLTPAAIVGLDQSKGSLARGKDADIVVMDRDFQVRTVLVRGQMID